MEPLKKYNEFINEHNYPMTDPQALSCPSCGVELDMDYYTFPPYPRECVGCGENLEEILNRKPWNWA